MLVDLHCHTLKTKTGDSSKRTVTSEKFLRKINEANVKIVAITNHNYFDLKQYTVLKEAVIGECEVWPGIELDIEGKNNRGHLIIIANPKNVIEFDKNVKALIGQKKTDEFLVKLQVVFNTLDICDVLYIPHFHKEPKLSEEDIEELNDLLDDKTRVFKETSDYRSLGVYSNFDYSVIIGSDVQDWDIYEQSKFAKIRLPVQTFEQFCLLAKKDKQIIDTLLKKKNKIEITVSPYKGIKFKIPIFEDVNIIFGQKGTGKSQILESIKEYYDKGNLEYKMYTGSDKESDFTKLLNVKNEVIDIDNLNLCNMAEEFKEIYDWQEKLPTSFQKYIDWMQTKDNNKNKSKMKITNAVFGRKIINDKKIDKDYKLAKEFSQSEIFSIDLNNYLNDKEAEKYRELTNFLLKNIYIKKTNDWLTVKSMHLTNFTINAIKSIADKCSDTVSKPGTTGFEEFAMNRFRLYDLVSTIYNELEKKEIIDTEYLGKLDEKGEIYIQKRYRLLCKESRKEEFNVGIVKLKKQKGALINLIHEFSKEKLLENLTEFKDLYDDEIRDISKFVGVSKNIALQDGSAYVPSGGEKGILLLQQLLDSECDAYLLDEPELGMGNSYITSSILPKIEELVRRKKTIIIATHNANIAVKTLPYMSIFRSHRNGIYSTYIGNPFCDELININDETDRLNWTNESMHTLEGGKTAFYERKNIYESGK